MLKKIDTVQWDKKKKGEKTSFLWRIKEVIVIGNILIVLKRIQLTKSNSLAKAFLFKLQIFK